MKRFTSIVLLLSINILLLAHAVIPHHHHAGVPHFSWFTTEAHHHHDACGHHDENGGEHSTCQLDLQINFIVKKDNVMTGVRHALLPQPCAAWETCALTLPLPQENLLQILPLPHDVGALYALPLRACGLRAPPVA